MSPVSWCALPYYDKKGGCEKFGVSCDCPPDAAIFDDIYEMDDVKMVACEFDISAYLLGMHWAHPDWSERQLRNVIYWQGQADKALRTAVRDYLKDNPDYTACFSPEAMAVDLRPTAAQLGITLEFPPTSRVWKIALLAKKKETEKWYSEDKAIVLIGDINDSRRFGPNERPAIQDRFIEFVESLDKKYGDKTLIPIRIAAGDDFIVVTKDRSIIEPIKREVKQLEPLGLRFTFGISWGDVFLRLHSGGVTGDAYYNAEKNLTRNKKKRKAKGGGSGR